MQGDNRKKLDDIARGDEGQADHTAPDKLPPIPGSDGYKRVGPGMTSRDVETYDPKLYGFLIEKISEMELDQLHRSLWISLNSSPHSRQNLHSYIGSRNRVDDTLYAVDNMPAPPAVENLPTIPTAAKLSTIPVAAEVPTIPVGDHYKRVEPILPPSDDETEEKSVDMRSLTKEIDKMKVEQLRKSLWISLKSSPHSRLRLHSFIANSDRASRSVRVRSFPAWVNADIVVRDFADNFGETIGSALVGKHGSQLLIEFVNKESAVAAASSRSLHVEEYVYRVVMEGDRFPEDANKVYFHSPPGANTARPSALVEFMRRTLSSPFIYEGPVGYMDSDDPYFVVSSKKKARTLVKLQTVTIDNTQVKFSVPKSKKRN